MARRGEIRSEEQYRQMLAEQAESGLSLTEFAKNVGVPYSTLAMWRIQLFGKQDRESDNPGPRPRRPQRKAKRRSRPASKAPAATPALVPVRFETTPVVGNELHLPVPPTEVVLRGERVLRVPHGFDAAELLTLIRLLESIEC